MQAERTDHPAALPLADGPDLPALDEAAQHFSALLKALVRRPARIGANVRVLAVGVKVRKVVHRKTAQDKALSLDARHRRARMLCPLVLLPAQRKAQHIQQLPVKPLGALAQRAFIDKAQLFHHPRAALVVGKAVDADERKPHLLKGVAQHLPQRLGHVALAPLLLGQQVAHRQRVLRAAFAALVRVQANKPDVAPALPLAHRPIFPALHHPAQHLLALFLILVRRPARVDSHVRVGTVGVKVV